MTVHELRGILALGDPHSIVSLQVTSNGAVFEGLLIAGWAEERDGKLVTILSNEEPL